MEASLLRLRPHLSFRCPNASASLPRRQHIGLLPSSIVKRHEFSMSLSLNGNHVGKPGYEMDTSIKYSQDQHGQSLEKSSTSSSNLDNAGEQLGADGSINVEVPQKRSAKIHDFCFGIPFGGFVLGGGLIGFLFSRNVAILSSGILFGGALLALSTCSLKIWRAGKSSLPFILGQAAIAAILFWKNFQLYASAKKLFPTGFYIFFSAAMFCFYSYVLLSGGNPPPKKLKAATSAS